MHRSKQLRYSITSSAKASSEGGTVRPSILAVWWLITSSNLVDTASARWKSESLRLRPNFKPFAIARLRPSPVRSRISSRSNSAMAANIVDSSRPCELPVSHSRSPSERNETPVLPMRLIR